MTTLLTDLEYQALLKVQRRLFHCEGWGQYLEIYCPESLEDFTRQFDLLILITKEDDVAIIQTLKRRFQQLVLIASIEYVKEKIKELGAPADFQIFNISRQLECRSGAIYHIKWQKPVRATLPAVTTHKWCQDSVITNTLTLESNLQILAAVSFVSTKDYFAITHATAENAYLYEPWLSWFVYLQIVELNELQTWTAYKEAIIDILESRRAQATMLFDLYLQTLSLIWPTGVPIPDLTALAAVSA